MALRLVGSSAFTTSGVDRAGKIFPRQYRMLLLTMPWRVTPKSDGVGPRDEETIVGQAERTEVDGSQNRTKTGKTLPWSTTSRRQAFSDSSL